MRARFGAIAIAVAGLAGCGSSGSSTGGSSVGPGPVVLPSGTSGTASVTPAEIAAKLVSGGVACPGYKITGNDPGATSQATCGAFPVVVEISVFTSHDSISTIYAPYLKTSFCGSSTTTTSYVDGGNFAVYTDDQPTTEQIAKVLGLPVIPLC